MLKKNEVEMPSSCLNRAGAEEPVFVLLGRDRAAAPAIRFWALERVKSGKNKPDDPEIIEARAMADLMHAYAIAVRDPNVAARPNPALNPAAAWPFPTRKSS